MGMFPWFDAYIMVQSSAESYIALNRTGEVHQFKLCCTGMRILADADGVPQVSNTRGTDSR